VIGFTCLIYSSFELIYFCFTSLNGFWATFPNVSHLNPKSRYNPWKVLMVCVMHMILVVEKKKNMQAYGKSFLLEWIWVKHVPFKHMRVECLFLWGSTYLAYSIFEWKCLLIILSCLRIFIHDMLWFLKSLVVLWWRHCNLYFVFVFLENEFEFCVWRNLMRMQNVMFFLL
jgi:hypothetical protein